MCQTGKEIRLCTCVPNGIDKIVHNKKSRRFKHLRNEFTWTLEECMGPSKTTMDGMGYRPEETLSEDLTAERMLTDLNSRNCFDFDYQPKEGDNLQVFTPENSMRKHMSFIFKNQEWIAHSYLPFKYEMEKVNYGTVTIENKK